MKPKLNTQKNTDVSDAPLTSKQEEIFDEFHSFFYEETPLTGSFITKLNEVDEVLSPLISKQRKSDFISLQKALVTAGVGEKEADVLATKAQDDHRDMGF